MYPYTSRLQKVSILEDLILPLLTIQGGSALLQIYEYLTFLLLYRIDTWGDAL